MLWRAKCGWCSGLTADLDQEAGSRRLASSSTSRPYPLGWLPPRRTATAATAMRLTNVELWLQFGPRLACIGTTPAPTFDPPRRPLGCHHARCW